MVAGLSVGFACGDGGEAGDAGSDTLDPTSSSSDAEGTASTMSEGEDEASGGDGDGDGDRDRPPLFPSCCQQIIQTRRMTSS